MSAYTTPRDVTVTSVLRNQDSSRSGKLFGRGLITFYPAGLRFLQLPPPDVPHRPIRLPPPRPARLPFERVREVLVTMGQTGDTALLGPQPDHVHAARFVPQHDVLDGAAAVVCHAGVGTVYGALSVGVPLVVAPLGADEPICAMGCVTAGTAVSLAPVPPLEEFMAFVTDPAAVTAAQVSDATARVLENPTYREAARRIAAEIAATPPPASTVPWLQSLAGAE